MTAIADARQVLEDRLGEIDAEEREIRHALQALTPPKKRKRISRSERREQVIAAMREHPEASQAEIARKLNVTPAYVSILLSEMAR